MGDGPHGHRDEAQVGRRPVRRRLRGRLEALQHQRRSQDAQGKSKFVILGQSLTTDNRAGMELWN